jgi:hypothetical protein
MAHTDEFSYILGTSFQSCPRVFSFFVMHTSRGFTLLSMSFPVFLAHITSALYILLVFKGSSTPYEQNESSSRVRMKAEFYRTHAGSVSM